MFDQAKRNSAWTSVSQLLSILDQARSLELPLWFEFVSIAPPSPPCSPIALDTLHLTLPSFPAAPFPSTGIEGALLSHHRPVLSLFNPKKVVVVPSQLLYSNFNRLCATPIRSLLLGGWSDLEEVELRSCNLLADPSFPRTTSSSAFSSISSETGGQPSRLTATYDLRRPISPLSFVGQPSSSTGPLFPPTFLEFFMGIRLEEGLFGDAKGAGGVRALKVIVRSEEEKEHLHKGLLRAKQTWPGRVGEVEIRVEPL